jgi:uncharacterized protein (DUF1778 family)
MTNKLLKTTNKKTERIEFLVSAPEKGLLEEAALTNGVSISHFIRHFSLLQAKFLLDGTHEQNLSRIKLGGVSQ